MAIFSLNKISLLAPKNQDRIGSPRKIYFRSSVQSLQKSPSAGVPIGSPYSCIPCGDSLRPRGSLSNQDMILSVSERFFWEVIHALKVSSGKMHRSYWIRSEERRVGKEC